MSTSSSPLAGWLPRIESKANRSSAARWLPLILCPFVFGLNVAVFPLDKAAALSATLAACAAAGVVGLLAPRLKAWPPLCFGGGLLLLILSLPFWSLGSREALVAPVKPVFSISEARANPQAFLAWWTFFVQEVLRTNEVIHMPDPAGILTHVLKPGAHTPFYKGSISINSLAYRGAEFPRGKANVYRILTLGESTTFGQTLFPESVPWSEVLQHLIDQNLTCDRPVQVINGGVNAYALRGGIERLKRDRDWLQPDMVLTYFGFNGAHDMGVDVSRWFPFAAVPELRFSKEASRLEIVTWFIRQSYRKVHSFVMSTYGTLNLMFSPPEEAVLLEQARHGKYYENYKEMMNETRDRQLVFLSFNTAVGPSSPEEAVRFYESVFYMARPWSYLLEIHNKMLQELAAQNSDHVHYVDTSAGVNGNYDGNIYLDYVHFTPKGDARMGANILKGIEPLLSRETTLNCRSKAHSNLELLQ